MEILNESNNSSWEKFCLENNLIPPQHLLKWRDAISNAYENCEPAYFMSTQDGETSAIFPFFKVKSRLFGNRIISQPFIDIGGPLGKLDKESLSEILRNIKENCGKDYKEIEIRSSTFLENFSQIKNILLEEGFLEESKKNQFILKLEGESENSLLEKFDRITKKGIKKAQNSELELRYIEDEKELEVFYNLYLNNMKFFGTPQHSFKFFINLLNSGTFVGLNCYKEGNLAATLICLHSKDYLYAAFNSSDHRYLKYQPNDMLHWEIIKWGIKNGMKLFDIGQCDANAEPGSHAEGIFNFKKKWMGTIYEKKYFKYYLRDKEKAEDNKGGKKRLIKIWKMLPLFIIKIIGPKIASQLAL